MSSASWLSQILRGSLDLLFPPVCGGCNRVGFHWCPDCQEQVQNVKEPVCRICGLPGTHPGQCDSCKTRIPAYEMLRSWSIFEGPVRSAVLNLKYHRNMALGDVLAHPLAEFVGKLDWQVDLVIPVPLGKERARDLGYNQIGIVAKPVAEIRHRQYAPCGLIRQRETKSQVGLTAAERKANVDGAFKADSEIVSGKRVLLMDDVATTGATISACASALLQADAKTVYALTLARALPHHGINII